MINIDGTFRRAMAFFAFLVFSVFSLTTSSCLTLRAPFGGHAMELVAKRRTFLPQDYIQICRYKAARADHLGRRLHNRLPRASLRIEILKATHGKLPWTGSAEVRAPHCCARRRRSGSHGLLQEGRPLVSEGPAWLQEDPG